jgi:chaperone modulatory protein CbpM
MSMSREQFLATSGAQVHKLEFWLEQRWLIVESANEGAAFTDREVARARLIQDLEGDFGVNNEGIDIILHLIDQLHGMRRAFAHLQAGLGERSSGS